MTTDCPSSGSGGARLAEPAPRDIFAALAFALFFVAVTRFPVARSTPIESDEFGFLEMVRIHWFPMHHTLFLTLARLCGWVIGDSYRGFIVLDVVMSALAMTGCWWWLRGLAEPKLAISATLLLGLGPMFWGYGAVAGNYTAIIFVGSVLLGIAQRTWRWPRPWHPYAAAVMFAFGCGYRSDIGTFWLPIVALILWRHRWRSALAAGGLCVVLSLAWFLTMLADVGGWAEYRLASARFAHSAGYLNSVWNLGVVDGAVRYAVKLTIALIWTLGPALWFVPSGLMRLRGRKERDFLAALLAISVLPALAIHLLVHFGSPGYAFHYIPALLALIVIGIGQDTSTREFGRPPRDRRVLRLIGAAGCLALVFWFYPTNYDRPGWRGGFDLAFARHTRAGLRLAMPAHPAIAWRTANSNPGRGNPRQ